MVLDVKPVDPFEPVIGSDDGSIQRPSDPEGSPHRSYCREPSCPGSELLVHLPLDLAHRLIDRRITPRAKARQRVVVFHLALDHRLEALVFFDVRLGVVDCLTVPEVAVESVSELTERFGFGLTERRDARFDVSSRYASVVLVDELDTSWRFRLCGHLLEYMS